MICIFKYITLFLCLSFSIYFICSHRSINDYYYLLFFLDLDSALFFWICTVHAQLFYICANTHTHTCFPNNIEQNKREKDKEGTKLRGLCHCWFFLLLFCLSLPCAVFTLRLHILYKYISLCIQCFIFICRK